MAIAACCRAVRYAGYSTRDATSKVSKRGISVPRINAATVAEHRAQQERSIIDATFELLHLEGSVPSLARVAAQAGLARTSIYQYFKSPQALLHAVAMELYPRWIARVSQAVDESSSAQEAIMAYAKVSVDQFAEGGHAVGELLAAQAPEALLDSRSEELHESVIRPLTNSLEQAGIEDPGPIAELVNAVIRAAGQMMERGMDRNDVHGYLEILLGQLGRSEVSLKKS